MIRKMISSHLEENIFILFSEKFSLLFGCDSI